MFVFWRFIACGASKTFPGGFAEPQIPPLRFAPVPRQTGTGGMTKERAVSPWREATVPRHFHRHRWAAGPSHHSGMIKVGGHCRGTGGLSGRRGAGAKARHWELFFGTTKVVP
jgi:hypothetical protein